jgi:hypothetical protein
VKFFIGHKVEGFPNKVFWSILACGRRRLQPAEFGFTRSSR